MTLVIIILLGGLVTLWLIYKHRVEQDALHDVDQQRQENLQRWADEEAKLKAAKITSIKKGEEYVQAKEDFLKRAHSSDDCKGDGAK